MKFSVIVEQVSELLRHRQRVSYRALKREFDLNDEDVEDLKAELIDAQRLAADEAGKVLVWIGASSVASSTFQVPSPQSPAPNLQPLAERRQLTVMFCDLVDSTTLSTQLDPEELREVMQTYQHACVDVITHFDGYVAKYLGDGLLVYFGYPTAHEDDAARAVRTSLGIIEALHNLTPQLPQPLNIRIGIHTGLVVAGEMGSGAYREQLAVVGEAPNLAARIQGQAAADEVLISASTHRLVEGLFTCESRGQPELRGVATPLALYRVVRESTAQSRFEVVVRTGLTPLVGRESELQSLREHWERAKTAVGQVVLLNGDPGIGKSRLVQELKEQLAHEGATRIEFRCSPYHQNSTLYPIINHLQRMLRFEREDSPEEKLKKLEEVRRGVHGHTPLPPDTIPLLAALLSLPHPEGYPLLTLSPQKQKEKTHAALVNWLVEETEKAPMLCIWEDLHWADSSTLEVLRLFLDQETTTDLLMLLTCRPEFTPPWDNKSHMSQMTLRRLERRHVESIVENITRGQVLLPEVLQQIVSKTDGVPLFVEELTKTVIESVGSLESSSLQNQLTFQESAIPATLHDSLMARLDRLGTAKEVAQLGATIGREFSYELIHAISHLDNDILQQGLKQLVEAELVYQRGQPPQAHYLFKHALVQDTAYQSLLKSTRQQYHRQIAQALAERFPETVETQPELLAHHYTEAGITTQAILSWQKAGQRAAQRSANTEAVSHLTKGLELLKALPETPARMQQELALQMRLATTKMIVRGYAAPEAEQAYKRARELCQRLGETPQLFPVLIGLHSFFTVRGDLQQGREYAEQCLRLARRKQDPELLLEAHTYLGNSLYFLGEFVAARGHYTEALALYDSQRHKSHTLLYGQDPGVMAGSYESWILYTLGRPDQAVQQSQKAVSLAKQQSHLHSLAQALAFTAYLYNQRREGQVSQEQAEAVVTLAAEQGLRLWLALGTFYRGWALVEQGQYEEGIAGIRQGHADYQATGARVNSSRNLCVLAEAYGKVGRVAEGLQIIDEAFAEKEPAYEAELWRVKGELALQSKVEEAEMCFLRAINIARKQQAKSWELRATTRLARLWQQQGKREEAHTLLSEVYNWFTEGFDTKDLQEARALLESLRN